MTKTQEKAKDMTEFTSIVSESSEVSTIFALKTSTNHMIWRLQHKEEIRYFKALNKTKANEKPLLPYLQIREPLPLS